MRRRAFLELLAAAPLAALVPWRPPALGTWAAYDAAFDVAVERSYSAIVHYYRGDVRAFVLDVVQVPADEWQLELLARLEAERRLRLINPPIVLT